MAQRINIPGLPPFAAPGAPPEDQVNWIRVAYSVVEELYDSGVVRVQRNHLRRLQQADHLTNTDLPLHRNYLAVRLPDGTTQLIDGYTRIAAIKAAQKPLPAQVWLGVVDAESAKAAEGLYLAVDSRRAVKTGRDAFEEGLRKAGLLGKLRSSLFINGNAVSALQVAAGDPDTRASVVRYKKAIPGRWGGSTQAGQPQIKSPDMAATHTGSTKH